MRNMPLLKIFGGCADHDLLLHLEVERQNQVSRDQNKLGLFQRKASPVDNRVIN